MTPFAALRDLAHGLALAGKIPDPFQYGFVVNAVLCGVFIGPVLGFVGTMVVTKRFAFFSQAVGQAALTGVALGILLGEPVASPYVALFGFCTAFALVLNFTRGATRMPTDTLIGVFLSISMAVGASLLVFVAGRINVHVVDQVLFGSILTVDDVDLAVLIAASVVVAVAGIVGFNRMVLGSFDPRLARARGVDVRLLDYVFVMMVTLVTVAAVKIVGAMLVEALLVIPAATSRVFARDLRQFVLGSIALAALACQVGILGPMLVDLPIPSGGAIVIVAAILFAGATALRLGRGQAA